MHALIISADGFEDSELLVPMYRLKEAGQQVTIAAPETGGFSGKHGYAVQADTTLDDLRPDDYDVLVIPGGKGPESVRLNQNAVAVTRKMMNDGKPVAAICHGGQVLISAGVLQGKRATCWEGIRDDLKAAGADYSDEEVVVDGNLITSRCPADLPAFCRELFNALSAE